MTRRPAQYPLRLPGIETAVRYGRTAAAQAPRTVEVKAGRGPLAWCQTVDPGDVLFHQWLPGEPRAKERPQVPRKPKEYKDRPGEFYVPPAFTPKKTRQATAELAWAFKACRRRMAETGSVGMRLIVLTSAPGGHEKDWDNLGKLISDAANGILYTDDVQVEEPSMSVRRNVPPDRAGVDILVWQITDRSPRASASGPL